ncbi:hypothetical protein Pmani_021805 [Petrolisthes manimaculis]|uniref:Uncharacterized protein n=1 Tax=Petrolisthes manimaculis TaxID=1843537 RepID=A0AAE1U536_9EUCA|nr:hypothetical protein Pmani_021805 [Petrolisthes manimaculis]
MPRQGRTPCPELNKQQSLPNSIGHTINNNRGIQESNNIAAVHVTDQGSKPMHLVKVTQSLVLEKRALKTTVDIQSNRQPEEVYGDPVIVKELDNPTNDHCGAVTLCVAETNPVVTTEGDTYGEDGEIASWPSVQEPLSKQCPS